MQKIRYLIIALLCAVAQGAWAQTEVSTEAALTTDYGYNGIKAYSFGLLYQNKLYSGEGKTVAFNVATAEDKVATGVKANGSDLSGDAQNGYTLTMAAEDYTVTATIEDKVLDDLALNDASANTTTIESENGKYYNVTIDNRTLYKDGSWNTLYLPFDVSAGKISANGNLQNCIIMELDVDGWYDDSGNRHDDYASGYHQTGYDDGTLYLYFQTVTDIDARRPYLIKWTKPEGYDASPSSFDFTPTFFSSYIESSSPRTVTSIDGTVSFKGIYDPVTLDGGDKSSLYLGVKDSKSALFYPNSDRPINAFRAFVLNFGDNDETTGIVDIEHGIFLDEPSGRAERNMEHSDNAVYDLQGRRVASSMLNVQSSMLKKGIYIYKGKKVIK